MKIIILGSNGMLGGYLINSPFFKDDEIIAIDRSKYPSFDFSDPVTTIQLIRSFDPDVVINCVAITSIEICEKNHNLADQVNTVTPNLIAQFCLKENIFFVHISTDHFYSGDERFAHSETDQIKLLNYYAVSKFEAEKKILQHNPGALVIRTSIIGITLEGRTFLDWAIRSIKENQKVTLFSDSYVSFIHCKQLALIMRLLISKKIIGLLNVPCSQVFSKAEFVLSLADAFSLSIDYQLGNVSTLSPPRPDSCGLSSIKLTKEMGILAPSMQEVVQSVVDECSPYMTF